MARARSVWYRHNQLLIPYGNDFDHQNAIKSFGQMDELMHYINGNSTYNMTLRYGGLADYVSAVNALGVEFPLLDQAHPLESNGNTDFFPYATGQNLPQYWSGFFTSRAQLKGHARSRDAVLRAAEFLYAVAADNATLLPNASAAWGGIDRLRRAVGVAQHHDAITGTEKQAVSDDYMEMLDAGTITADRVSATVAAKLLAKGAAGEAAAAAAAGAGAGAVAAAAGPVLFSPENTLAFFPFEDGPVEGCVAWRQTWSCSPTGRPHPEHDRNCSASITAKSGSSGYCECFGGARRAESTCSHGTFTCEDMCQDVPRPPSGKVAAVVLLNTLPWARQQLVSLPVGNATGLVVRDSLGQLIASQINPGDADVALAVLRARRLQFSNGSASSEEAGEAAAAAEAAAAGGTLLFIASLTPTAMQTVFVSKEPAAAVVATVSRGAAAAANLTLENAQYKVYFDDAATEGRLSKVVNKVSGLTAAVAHDFVQYLPDSSSSASGAYIFHPVYGGSADVGSCDPKKQPKCAANVVKRLFEVVRPNPVPNATTALFAQMYTQPGETYPDTFTPTIRGALEATGQAAVNVARTDNRQSAVSGLGWGQDISAGYLAMENGRHASATFLRSGTWAVGASPDGPSRVRWFAFPAHAATGAALFDAVPRLVLQPRGGDSDDTFTATAFNVTAGGCSVNVTIVNPGATAWAQTELAIGWLAWEAQSASAAAASEAREGQVVVTLPALWTDPKVTVQQLTLALPSADPSPYTLLADIAVVAAGAGADTGPAPPAAFGVTVYKANATHFHLNVNRVFPHATNCSAGQQIAVSFVAVPKEVRQR
jgi:hypothetical protein